MEDAMKQQRLKNRFRELLGIKERKESRRISQREVAEQTGIAKATVDRIARQETTRFDEHVILALCNYLECGVGDLFIIEEVDEEGQTKTLLASA
jgi:DNA-binding Xre family transcriptional regulator